MRALRNGLHGAGIPVENSKGEWGPGQEEINVTYAEALEMADRHAIIKNGAKEIAHGLGKAITFMAKWDYGMAGSSCHVHQSLSSKDGKSPLFLDESGDHGMSATMTIGSFRGRCSSSGCQRPLRARVARLRTGGKRQDRSSAHMGGGGGRGCRLGPGRAPRM